LRGTQWAKSITPRDPAGAEIERNANLPRLLRNEGRERSQPRFIATPRFDRAAVNWLTRLPLARRLDDARIELGPKTGLIPRQAAGGDQTTDGGLRIAHQWLVIYLDETTARIAATSAWPPVGNEACGLK